MDSVRPLVVHCFEYPPTHGGISRLCGEIARALDERGTLQAVVTQAADVPPPPPYPPGRRINSRRPIREAAAFACIRRSGVGVLAGIWYPEGLIAWLARSRPLIVLAHGLELRPTSPRWRRGFWKWLRERVLSSADLVVANSAYTAGLVCEVAPVARVVAIPLGVDHSRFTPVGRRAARQRLGLHGERVITTVARVQAYKGHDTVLRALAALAPDELRGMVYLVAGKGPHLDQLKVLAADLGLADNVRWLGFVPETELPDLYRATDLFVLCTRDEPDTPDVEGFGLVFLEAQACGTPVIGTRTGGIPEAIENGRGGWLIEQDDVSALTEHLRRLIAEPDYYEAVGQDGRSRVEANFTWEHYTDRFLAALAHAGIDV